MHKWFWSLQFRLVLGFALALALTLAGISAYVSYAAEKEVQRFQQEQEEARAARLQRWVSGYYARRHQPGVQHSSGDMSLQPVLEQAGNLYSWRIVAKDPQGRIIADSHPGRLMPPRRRLAPPQDLPIETGGLPVASIAVFPEDQSSPVPDPPWSSLVGAFKRSLLWGGIAAGLSGILFVSLLSGRVLAPVGSLSAAARRLGQGDLGQRVPVRGRDEVGELARTFNTMAQDLETAEKLRRTLMADVAHELRTPLSNIQGYLEAIKDGLLQPDAATLDTIHEQVLHLGNIVEDLRLLALAEAGALRLDREPDSLEEVLRRSVEAIKPRAAQRGLTVSLEVSEKLPLVNMDRTRIAQVLGNLLENAVTHTPQEGQVSVRGEVIAGGTSVRVTVADTGSGIPPEDLPHVFERFYRVDSARSRSTGGAGLGLTIAKQLVEAHRGVLRAESTLGQGSRFILELPVDVGRPTTSSRQP